MDTLADLQNEQLRAEIARLERVIADQRRTMLKDFSNLGQCLEEHHSKGSCPAEKYEHELMRVWTKLKDQGSDPMTAADEVGREISELRRSLSMTAIARASTRQDLRRVLTPLSEAIATLGLTPDPGITLCRTKIEGAITLIEKLIDNN